MADDNRNTILFAKYADHTRVNLISNELFGDYCLVKSFENIENRLDTENITVTKITPKRRLERRLIDKVALREAVLNALLHNDYANGSAPKVEVFSDRVEITSYGGLPYGVTLDDFFNGRSLPRNPELMRVFRDLEIVEQLGSGVPRITATYSRDVFEISDNYIRVILPFARSEDVNKGMILDLVSLTPSITISEIAETLDLSVSSAKSLIDGLKGEGVLVRVGAKKNGSLVVNRLVDKK